jgi:hypothetical protein
VFGDQPIHYFAALCEIPNSADLINAHESAIAGDVGSEDGAEPAYLGLLGPGRISHAAHQAFHSREIAS